MPLLFSTRSTRRDYRDGLNNGVKTFVGGNRTVSLMLMLRPLPIISLTVSVAMPYQAAFRRRRRAPYARAVNPNGSLAMSLMNWRRRLLPQFGG